MGRLEADGIRQGAMNLLGNGLHDACHHGDALTVREAELSMRRRLGDSEFNILIVQGNIANTYEHLGRNEEALQMRRGVYSGRLKLSGEEHRSTLMAANNYAESLLNRYRFKEARTLLCKMMPVARRILGESNEITLTMRWNYAKSLYMNTDGTLNDLREAVTTLEDTDPIARRVLGGAHPLTRGIEKSLKHARAALRAREAPSPGGA